MGFVVLLLATVLAQVLPGSTHPRWATVLTGFDLIRADAFERGRPDLLDRVYVPGSEILRVDRRMLETYSDRGIRIDDLRMSVLSAEPVERSPRRIRLEVLDRLLLTRVSLPDGSVRDLPRDQPSRHTIDLVLTEAGWRISAVRQ